MFNQPNFFGLQERPKLNEKASQSRSRKLEPRAVERPTTRRNPQSAVITRFQIPEMWVDGERERGCTATEVIDPDG